MRNASINKEVEIVNMQSAGDLSELTEIANLETDFEEMTNRGNVQNSCTGGVFRGATEKF